MRNFTPAYLVFDLLTDYKPLEFVYSRQSKPSARIERWVLRIQPYRYRVVHIPGRKNRSLSMLILEKDTTTINPVHSEIEDCL